MNILTFIIKEKKVIFERTVLSQVYFFQDYLNTFQILIANFLHK